MNKNAKIALDALYCHRGDDLYRAQSAFRGLSQKQMQEQHGMSGKTRQQIINEYQEHADKTDAAIAWVKSVAN